MVPGNWISRERAESMAAESLPGVCRVTGPAGTKAGVACESLQIILNG